MLAACLASIDRCRPLDVEIEVIVVDDASTDGTADWLVREFPWARLVQRDQNGGFCLAANDGIAAARAPIIQLLNNDTEVTPGWVEAGLRPFADPGVGSVAPLALMRGDPTRVDSAGDGYWFFGLPCKRGHGQSAVKWRGVSPGPVFGASGSSAIYRASAIKRIGGFDPRFGSYYEDVDLAFRLRRDGFTCVYLPSCVILHEISASYVHSDHELQRRMARNAEWIFWTRNSMPRLLIGLVPHLAFLMAQAAQRALQGRLRPFLLGKLDALAARGMRPEQSS